METLLVYPEKKKELQAVKDFLKTLNIRFEAKSNDVYNAEFVAKIEESRKEIADGKGVRMSIKELWN